MPVFVAGIYHYILHPYGQKIKDLCQMGSSLNIDLLTVLRKFDILHANL